MTTESDIRFAHMGELELLGKALPDVAGAHRRMCKPLTDAITALPETGNDRADAKALSEKLVGLFERMDDDAVAAWAERVLMQAYAIGRNSAIPSGLAAEERRGIPETTEVE